MIIVRVIGILALTVLTSLMTDFMTFWTLRWGYLRIKVFFWDSLLVVRMLRISIGETCHCGVYSWFQYHLRLFHFWILILPSFLLVLGSAIYPFPLVNRYCVIVIVRPFHLLIISVSVCLCSIISKDIYSLVMM